MVEKWKEIKGFEGQYRISNLGRVKSLSRLRKQKGGGYALLKERIMKTRTNNCGFQYVLLHSKCFLIHRLVAEAFVHNDDPVNKKYVQHKDKDKANNHCRNLEWVVMPYGCRHYKKHPKKKLVLKKTKIIQQFTKGGFLVNTYPSVVEATKQTGINNIYGCLKGLHKSAGGYVWKRIITYTLVIEQ